ncbi:NAD-dependent epimerase/dehydratase family protein [Microbaculum marinisediminis]|uniref:NAD(P)H-binding protein n=1 Tax=Microbaculum marinisediminis TaxID=2931392 RepID=A0AAW5R5Z3_9HYPH|nr:NAD-dependent epimerase/dehydratase family protein [Microbaculum sp. A6E488]MCT8974534.1 NAD(P)H-binding protein [Microbaculum sp. A6E488]
MIERHQDRKTALILGARGRLGRVVLDEFVRRGWRVRALVRSATGVPALDDVVAIEGDARSRRDLIAAAEGVDVIVNATNPPFPAWQPAVFEITEAVISAARTSGAVHLFPGNIYNYGWPMPDVISETTPQRPTTRKGAIRVEAERRYREAADLYGVRTIVLRAGDYFGGDGRGSWFDQVIAGKAARGKMTYPGPLNLAHAWAYLPDLAATFEALARQRDEFGTFETFHFAGHTATGADVAAAMETAIGRPLSVGRLPWRVMRLAAPVVRSWRELSELAYLWHVAHRLDGAKLEMAIGEIPHTSFDRAIRESLDALGIDTRPTRPAAAQLAAV